MSVTLPRSFDPFDTAADRDPWGSYVALRDDAPVWEFAPGVFLVTRHADVRCCLLDHSALSNRSNFFLGDLQDFAEPTNITMMDRPRHSVLRRVELGGFSRGPIRGAAPWIAEVADRLIDEFVDDGEPTSATSSG